MQKKADRVLDTELAELQAEHDEMVIVNPNDVARLEQGRDKLREASVDVAVDIKKPSFELGQVEPVVEHWPKN